MTYTRCYRDGQLVDEGFPISQVSEHLADEGCTVWFDLCRPDREQLAQIGEELSLHDLAIEDVLDAGQRPKLDHYPHHLFVVAYATDLDPQTQQLRQHEVAMFVTPRALVTVRAEEGFDIDAVLRQWDSMAGLARAGVPFLLHGLLDYMVDSHYETVQRMDTVVDGLEDRLFDEITSDATLQRQTFEVRKSLVQLRRLVLPMREVINSLMRRDLDILDDTLTPYFQDVYDNVLRVSEWTDSLRDLLANILETRLTVRGNRLNVIMKKVTSWAAIIAVPTAVTGFYGQNIPYPGFQQPWGFWVSSAVILAASGGLYLVFKRKDWL